MNMAVVIQNMEAIILAINVVALETITCGKIGSAIVFHVAWTINSSGRTLLLLEIDPDHY